MWPPWQHLREEKLLCIKEPSFRAESNARPHNAANKVVALGLEPRSLDAKAQLLRPPCPGHLSSVPVLHRSLRRAEFFHRKMSQLMLRTGGPGQESRDSPDLAVC